MNTRNLETGLRPFDKFVHVNVNQSLKVSHSDIELLVACDSQFGLNPRFAIFKNRFQLFQRGCSMRSLIVRICLSVELGQPGK